MLAKHKRDQYRLSTTVGRIVLDEIDTQARNFGEKGDLFKFGRPNKIVYDYTEKGAMKSIEDSLKRLGVDRLDFVWIHDVAGFPRRPVGCAVRNGPQGSFPRPGPAA